jgi:hypothetical protein
LVWALKKEHRANHIWDCKVYSSFAAEQLGAHSLPDLQAAKTTPAEKPRPRGSGWLDDLPKL